MESYLDADGIKLDQYMKKNAKSNDNIILLIIIIIVIIESIIPIICLKKLIKEVKK